MHYDTISKTSNLRTFDNKPLCIDENYLFDPHNYTLP